MTFVRFKLVTDRKEQILTFCLHAVEGFFFGLTWHLMYFGPEVLYMLYTGHTQQNGAVSIVNTVDTAPFFCVCPVYSVLWDAVLCILAETVRSFGETVLFIFSEKNRDASGILLQIILRHV
jgi:hypothetical protein